MFRVVSVSLVCASIALSPAASQTPAPAPASKETAAKGLIKQGYVFVNQVPGHSFTLQKGNSAYVCMFVKTPQGAITPTLYAKAIGEAMCAEI